MEINIKHVGTDVILVSAHGRLDLDNAVEYGTAIKENVEDSVEEIKELMLEEDPGQPVPPQHDPVGFFRIGAAFINCTASAERNIIFRQLALRRQHFFPPVIDFRNF